MSEKTLLAEVRDLYSSNNCEDVIEKSIRKIYKILTINFLSKIHITIWYALPIDFKPLKC